MTTVNLSIHNSSFPISSTKVTFGRAYYVAKFALIMPVLFESAMKNLFCLEALRHGTAMENIIAIKNNGANPALSSMFQGKSWAVSDNLFYVMRDSGLFTKKSGKKLNIIIANIVKRLATLEYKIAAEKLNQDKNKAKIYAIAKGCFNPTLSFYFDYKDVPKRFKDDPRLTGLGLITKHKIKNSRIGISGAIKYGANKRWGKRIKKNPIKFSVGILQTIACFALLPLALFSLPVLITGKISKVDKL